MSSSTLSIRLNTRTKAKLDALAKASRRSKSFLAAEAIEAFVAAESWQLGEIEGGIKDLDANRTVDHSEVRQWLEYSLPLELKRKMIALLGSQISRQLKRRGVTEEEVLADFDAWRKTKREARRRR